MPLRSAKGKQRFPPPRAVLALLVLALLALNHFALELAIDISPARGDAKTSAAIASSMGAGLLDERRMGSEADYIETVKRPLFNPTRRPVDTTKPQLGGPSSVSSLQPLQVQLVGLAVTSTRGRRHWCDPVPTAMAPGFRSAMRWPVGA